LREKKNILLICRENVTNFQSIFLYSTDLLGDGHDENIQLKFFDVDLFGIHAGHSVFPRCVAFDAG
jgi:hypothetical protein